MVATWTDIPHDDPNADWGAILNKQMAALTAAQRGTTNTVSLSAEAADGTYPRNVILSGNITRWAVPFPGITLIRNNNNANQDIRLTFATKEIVLVQNETTLVFALGVGSGAVFEKIPLNLEAGFTTQLAALKKELSARFPQLWRGDLITVPYDLAWRNSSQGTFAVKVNSSNREPASYSGANYVFREFQTGFATQFHIPSHIYVSGNTSNSTISFTNKMLRPLSIVSSLVEQTPTAGDSVYYSRTSKTYHLANSAKNGDIRVGYLVQDSYDFVRSAGWHAVMIDLTQAVQFFKAAVVAPDVVGPNLVPIQSNGNQYISGLTAPTTLTAPIAVGDFLLVETNVLSSTNPHPIIATTSKIIRVFQFGIPILLNRSSTITFFTTTTANGGTNFNRIFSIRKLSI